MNRFLRQIYTLTAVLMLLIATSCGGGALEKKIRTCLVEGDTTDTAFSELCEIIRNDSRYQKFVLPDGEIDADALSELVSKIGRKLRPAINWDVKALASKTSLIIYLERSGSMTPYDTKDGKGELKKTVNDLINYFPGETHIFIVNDSIYNYNHTVDEFLKDKDIFATTAGIGDPSYTDFDAILDAIAKDQTPNQVSALITDMIYSPKETEDLSTSKVFNEESSLATNLFNRYSNKSVIVSKLIGSYHGPYYPYNQKPVTYHGSRPYYVLLIGDADLLSRMAANKRFANFLKIDGAQHSYRFNQPEQPIDWCILPEWDSNCGRYRISRSDNTTITHCEGDRTTGVLQFSIAANLSTLGLPKNFVGDVANYTIQSLCGFEFSITPITDDDITGNNRSFLDGKTHIITFSARITGAADTIRLSLQNNVPEWIEESNSDDDQDTRSPRFSDTTFGLKYFLGGISQAFAQAGQQPPFTTITINIEM